MKKQGFKLRLLPVIVFTALVILIIKAQSYSIEINNMPNIPIDSSTQLWDVFCYAKSTMILIVSVWAAFTMVYLLIVGRVKIKKADIYKPMIVYTLCVLISYALSNYKWIAWNGGVGRFEGTRTILCYMFMLFYTINVVDELRDAVIIVIAAAVSVLVECLVGITQLFGHDVLLTDIASRIMLESEGYSVKGEFMPGQVYQTVGNMNYVGMYLALIVPVLIYAIIYLNSKKNTQQLLTLGIDNKKRNIITILTGLILFMIALNVYGANSMGGLIGIGVAVAVMLIVLCDRKSIKLTMAAVAILGTVGVLLFAYVTGVDEARQIEYIETGVDSVKMSVEGNELTINYDRTTDEYMLLDEDGNPISIFVIDDQPGRYQPDDDRFVGKVYFVPLYDVNGEPCLVVSAIYNDTQYGFTFHEGYVTYLNPYQKEVSLGKVDSVGFKNHLSAGSGRGYIWSRTIPLLKDNFLFGLGADTFLFVFPQGDYAGKLSAGMPLEELCDKAHNMYLHMAVGTGGISVVAFLVLLVMSLRKVFCLGKDKVFFKVIAAGIVGFLFAGLFNDSTVCIMPMFYGYLGIVIAEAIKN